MLAPTGRRGRLPVNFPRRRLAPVDYLRSPKAPKSKSGATETLSIALRSLQSPRYIAWF
jgi:hypothetical protein